MNTVTMPGFTADASLYKMVGFRGAAPIIHSNNGGNVQPALKMTCFNIGVAYAYAYSSGNLALADFWIGMSIAFKC
jgi:hypothetical protein